MNESAIFTALEVIPIVEVAGLSITEGNSGTTTAQLNLNLSDAAPVDLSLNYNTEDLDAVAGSDYIAKSGQINIPAGQTSATIDLEVIGDFDFESVELFNLNLSAPEGAIFSSNESSYTVSVTIANDDAQPRLVEGDEADNNLIGGSGNDTINGRGGDDTLTGNEGNDTLNGGADNDTLVETTNKNFNLTNTTLVGNGNDTISQIESARLQGGAGNNSLDASAATTISVVPRCQRR